MCLRSKRTTGDDTETVDFVIPGAAALTMTGTMEFLLHVYNRTVFFYIMLKINTFRRTYESLKESKNYGVTQCSISLDNIKE